MKEAMVTTKRENKNKGITLVSLVVTIIILIILAGVSLNLTLGDNGLITMAKMARENMELAQIEDQKKLNELYTQIEKGGEFEGDITVGELQQTIEDLQGTVDDLTNQLENEQAQKAELEKRIKELESQLQQEQANKAELEKQLEDLNTELEAEKAKEAELEKQVAEKDKQIEDLEKELKSKNEQLANKEKTIQELQASKDDLEKRVENLEGQIKDLKEQLAKQLENEYNRAYQEGKKDSVGDIIYSIYHNQATTVSLGSTGCSSSAIEISKTNTNSFNFEKELSLYETPDGEIAALNTINFSISLSAYSAYEYTHGIGNMNYTIKTDTGIILSSGSLSVNHTVDGDGDAISKKDSDSKNVNLNLFSVDIGNASSIIINISGSTSAKATTSQYAQGRASINVSNITATYIPISF